MELYYKDLISEEASLEKLVDDLMLLVQGANELVEAAGAGLPAQPREEVTSRLRQLKDTCRRLQQQAVQSARATDRMLRRYPYSALGVAFGIGLLAGVILIKPKRSDFAGCD
jgi:ElaB/YqjD/DUF883 family membrane-anchored ribosome-binding protein